MSEHADNLKDVHDGLERWALRTRELQAELAGAKQAAAAAQRERDQLREQLEVAQGQLRVSTAALRGSEEGREAAVSLVAVLRGHLEIWAKGGRPVEATERVLRATAGLPDPRRPV